MSSLLVVLPLAGFILLFRALRQWTGEWRSAAISAAIAWGVFVAISTEILSIPNQITRGGISLAWLILCGACLIGARSIPRGIAPHSSGDRSGDRLLLAGIAVIVLLVGLTALLSPPNTIDAMMYHMPRVSEWAHHHNIDYYPTLDYQQLTMPPLAEYAMLHLFVLAGGDWLVNMIQWLAFTGCIIGVSLIAASLGAGRPGQVLAAVFCATIPIGILMASGAKNDWVLSFCLTACVYFLLRWREYPTWPVCLAFGASLALTLFTKGTAYTFLPCLIVAGWWMGSSATRRVFLARLPVIALLVLAVNGPQWFRSYNLSGSPLGFSSPDGEADREGRRQFRNKRLTLPGTFANVVRNAAIHFGTPVFAVNKQVERGAVWLIRAAGADPNDPGMLEDGWSGRHFDFHVDPTSRHETEGGNLIHASLLCVVLVLLLSRGRAMPRDLVLFSAGVIGSFVLFCALIRWMPFNARLHIPVFVLASSIVGVVLSKYCHRAVSTTLGILLIVTALPFVLTNKSRPLVAVRSMHDQEPEAKVWGTGSILSRPRQELYFSDERTYLANSYIAAAQAIRSEGCQDVAVDASLLHFEYPLMALLADRSIRYAGVENRSLRYAGDADRRAPCAVVCIHCAKEPRKWEQYRSVGGRASVFDDLAVFSAEPKKT